jgi:hypothetical protein
MSHEPPAPGTLGASGELSFTVSIQSGSASLAFHTFARSVAGLPGVRLRRMRYAVFACATNGVEVRMLVTPPERFAISSTPCEVCRRTP